MEPVLTEVSLGPVHDGLPEAAQAGAMTDLRWFHGRCDARHYSVGQSRDDIAFGRDMPPDWRWHVSVGDRPRWSDLMAIVRQLCPGVMFAVGVPPADAWMSYHPHALHAYEIHDENLKERWRYEGRATRSTPT